MTRRTAPIQSGPQHQAVLTWTEEQLQANAINAAEQFGWSAYHTYDSRRSRAGFPDLVLWHPRQKRFLLRELKTEQGVLSATQTTTIQTMQAAGADVAVWRPRDWVSQQIIKELRGAVVA
ncbi:VRR-NUC domain-containing protein [Arthrobacter sp. zg-Y20]|uniref:VRR-NUC domain-containing protein n=1 Tax=unclassified Arthrobacter TaxID=235627 RepID=UPI001D13569A|nr:MULTISPECIES: VRR-NUC domain-containing protein [unclassified Arthrobacter]MCC3276390.1 VRR-NUC domain-containing protein [Arthrobacter sp. zg-Y20]MDK1316549.1 VRR-NUC domain-containing protein [Arthrobacter sp. zg.Y20]WIB06589.1 VRR-NUC domain-containing protein [Arthrobacter sp. zg-Y20]